MRQLGRRALVQPHAIAQRILRVNGRARLCVVGHVCSFLPNGSVFRRVTRKWERGPPLDLVEFIPLQSPPPARGNPFVRVPRRRITPGPSSRRELTPLATPPPSRPPSFPSPWRRVPPAAPSQGR